MSGDPAGAAPPRLVLASASPARLATLRAAGFAPEVRVSGVDEAAVPAAPPAELCLTLARLKAQAVAAGIGADGPGTLVLGCDSLLELDGEVHGKPRDSDEARTRWRRMRGRSGVLHTGHWLVRTTAGGAAHDVAAPGFAALGFATSSLAASGLAASSGLTASGLASTTVHFADLTDAEVDAYVATGEPLAVAGAFTVDGLGGPFVVGIEGDHHNVVGVSLPLLRVLLRQLGVALPDLWAR